jgi:hypothetical protein
MSRVNDSCIGSAKSLVVATHSTRYGPPAWVSPRSSTICGVTDWNRFWYSLGLFLPFVDLQADKVWKPKADQTFLRNYMRVHILLGWILIPLVLAALTGLIK